MRALPILNRAVLLVPCPGGRESGFRLDLKKVD